MSGVPCVNNFANPITFLCGAIQAASRLGAEQSAKLCVQYLAPIVKNRQYNFPPLGAEPLRRCRGPAQRGHLQRGLAAAGLRSAASLPPRTVHRRRPRRRHRHGAAGRRAVPRSPLSRADGAAVTPNPADGLTGLMVPPEVGS